MINKSEFIKRLQKDITTKGLRNLSVTDFIESDTDFSLCFWAKENHTKFSITISFFKFIEEPKVYVRINKSDEPNINIYKKVFDLNNYSNDDRLYDDIEIYLYEKLEALKLISEATYGLFNK